MLCSLEITNFRTFSHLVIERLGRVNLIVGKNGVGKTTLLEALRVHQSIQPPGTVASILRERNEVARSSEAKTLLLLDSMFHGRHPKKGDAIRIGQPGADKKTPLFVATRRIQPEWAAPSDEAPADYSSPGQAALSIQSFGLHFTVLAGGGWAWAGGPENWTPPTEPPFDPPYLRSVGVQEDLGDTIAGWWDDVSLLDAVGRVVDSLRAIAPIQGISLVGDPRENRGRMAKVSVEGTEEPVALATLGDGAVRMFQLAVALEYAAVYARRAAKGEFRSDVFPLLLIDEIEAGIHHSLHANLWRFIFKTARLLDVQVFATTHSQDCLRGFAEAVAEDEEADGQVIRLEKDADEEDTRAIVVGREKLPIVVRDSIEVR